MGLSGRVLAADVAKGEEVYGLNHERGTRASLRGRADSSDGEGKGKVRGRPGAIGG